MVCWVRANGSYQVYASLVMGAALPLAMLSTYCDAPGAMRGSTAGAPTGSTTGRIARSPGWRVAPPSTSICSCGGSSGDGCGALPSQALRKDAGTRSKWPPKMPGLAVR